MPKSESEHHMRPVARRHWLVLAARWLVLIGVLIGLNLGIGALLRQYADPFVTSGKLMLNLTFILLLLAYILLLAMPFVPGVEIGISLLVAHGSVAAPFVYLATLGGLSLAYGIGVLLSGKVSCRFLMTLGLTRACYFVDEMKLLSRAERLERMQQALPDWAGRWFLGRRSWLLALLLNLPGNSLIGGGGGIAMLAGLSRTFSALQYFLTIALATLPIPLLVFFFGAGMLH
jgi:hypothetical protein